MPEAPEVSVAAAQLGEVASGRTLRSLTVTHPRTMRGTTPAALDRFAGARLEAVGRHGKWMVLGFAGRDERLGIHLRMSGQLRVQPPGTPHPDRHVHAVLTFQQEDRDERLEIWFRDPRTFGELRPFVAAPVATDLLDPRLDGDVLHRDARRRRVGVKAVLLDQVRAVSGIGSYLADEALHRAGVAPVRPSDSLPAETWQRILDEVRAVTRESAAVGGVTLADEGWVDLWGRPGGFASSLRVHARDRCRSCGDATCRTTVGGRSARWCPTCQG